MVAERHRAKEEVKNKMTETTIGFVILYISFTLFAFAFGLFVGNDLCKRGR